MYVKKPDKGQTSQSAPYPAVASIEQRALRASTREYSIKTEESQGLEPRRRWGGLKRRSSGVSLLRLIKNSSQAICRLQRAVRWQQFGYFCFFPSPFLICKQDRKTGINNLIVSALLPHFLCAIRQYFVAHTHIYLDSQHVH